MADISIRLFLTSDEFIALIDHARHLGADILYSLGSNRFARTPSAAKVPDELRALIREAKHTWSIFLVAGGAEPDAHHPDALTGRLVAAYFGGGGDGYLNLTEASARSTDAQTLALAKAVKSYLTKISKQGVAVFALPNGDPKPVSSIRYTDGAARALRTGAAWRASGVANNGYRLLET